MSGIMDLINDFKDGKIAGISKHKLRDESKQERFQAERLKGLKKESQMQEKLLILTEYAIPFNPMTGEEDETYNRDQKFRPYQANSTVLRMLKGMANQSEGAKNTFMRKAGVDEWDTEDIETITDVDRAILKRYRVPRTFTLPVTNVNIPAFTGNVYGKDYLVEVEKDQDTQEYIGEIPLPLKVNKLLSDMVFEEINKLNAEIKAGKVTFTEQEKKDEIKKFWKKVVVSGEFPRNYVMAVGIKLDAEGAIANKADIVEMEPKDMIENLYLLKRSDELKKSLDKYNGGAQSKFDYYDDFYEFDMNCTKESDPMQLGKDTRYVRAVEYLKDAANVQPFIDSVTKLVDSDRDWEQIFLSSVFVSKFNPSLEDSFLQCCSKIINLDDEFLTNKVVQANQQIIELVFGEEGENRVAESMAGMGNEGSLDEKASSAANKEHTIDIGNLANNVEDMGSETTELNLDLNQDK